MICRQEPIGVFDSGVGGLSVLAHIRARLPHEQLIYIADSAFMPYGCKAELLVQQRCLKIASFLASVPCKAMVVACNTATASAVHLIRDVHACPVIGMEPAVKPAVLYSSAKVIAVLTTTGTARSDKLQRLTARFSQQARVIIQACPGLVECIEAGDLHGLPTRALLNSLLQPLLEQGVDTLVLGCTHYPFLLPLIRELVGDGLRIIDAGDAVARELERQLQQGACMAAQSGGGVEFWSSGEVDVVEPVLSRLWGSAVCLRQLPF